MSDGGSVSCTVTNKLQLAEGPSATPSSFESRVISRSNVNNPVPVHFASVVRSVALDPGSNLQPGGGVHSASTGPSSEKGAATSVTVVSGFVHEKFA